VFYAWVERKREREKERKREREKESKRKVGTVGENLKKPNILLITTDQQRADHLGVKGMTAIRTPNLDRLAKEGVHFDRAYCPSPICTPSRLSLLTGLWPSKHGAFSIGVTADPFPEPTLPQLLSKEGYATALIGKAHFVRRDEEAFHFTGKHDPDLETFRNFRGPYLGFEQVYTCIGHTRNRQPNMHYRLFLEDQGVDYERWFPLSSDRNRKDVPGVWDIVEQYQNTAWIASTTIEWIRQRQGGQPWFCWTSFEDPHPPYVCPEPWYSSVDPNEVKPFEGKLEGEFDDKPGIYELLYQNKINQQYSDGPAVPCAYGRRHEGKDERNALQATFGMIANIDAKLGSIMAALEATGQLTQTVILFTSDHGEMHGHHGLWGKGLPAYEDNQRIPLLIWGPGFFEGKGTTPAIANLVDVTSTILSMAGASLPVGIQGTDLTPVLRGEAASVQDSTIVECQATKNIYQQTFITDRYKLVLYRDSKEGELYDLSHDPDQYVNLWGQSDYWELRSELMHQFLQRHMQREGVKVPRLAFA
jgi:arylsulfatase A-like enzyme